jgi:hypothetical protein
MKTVRRLLFAAAAVTAVWVALGAPSEISV